MHSIALDETNVEQDVMTLFCENLSAINISKKHVQHSRTKHINIHYHLIKELVEDKIINLDHIEIEKQIVDIFTKVLDVVQFEKLRVLLVFAYVRVYSSQSQGGVRGE